MSEYYPYVYKGYPKDYKYPRILPMPSERERDLRWYEIKRVLQKHELDCLIVTVPAAYMSTLPNYICYISNYMPFVSIGTYIVFPLKGEPLLRVESSMGPQFVHCATETSWIKEIVGSMQPGQDIVRKVKELKLENGRLGIVGYQSGIFPASVYNALRENLPSAFLVEATAVLGEAMDEVSRTSEEEKALLRKACEILDVSYNALAEMLRPGVKEYDLWAAAEQAIVMSGGWNAQFMIASSGQAPTFLRAPGSHNLLGLGDVVMFEINTVYGGISAQASFALSLGQPKAEIEKMFEFCGEAYHFVLVDLEKNRTFMEIEQDLVKRIHTAGYEPMTPQIHLYNASVAIPVSSPPQPGDYFTVHPNVCNKDYTAAAKFGDTVHMKKDGKVERLQATPARLNIVYRS